MKSILLLAIVINICFVAAEATVGYLIGPILSLLVSFVIAVPSVKLIIRTTGKIKA